jgi:uncharacterized protein YkwD
MKKTFLKAILPLVLMFTMVSCSSDASEGASLNSHVVNHYNYNTTELRMVTLINDYRISQGLNSLQVVNHISYKSEEHNEYMIDKKVVNHDFFHDRSTNIIQVLGAERVGENIAYNYVTAESALSAWLNSPTHKANIIGDYTHFGISVSVDPVSGRKYYTNMFMKKR